MAAEFPSLRRLESSGGAEQFVRLRRLRLKGYYRTCARACVCLDRLVPDNNSSIKQEWEDAISVIRNVHVRPAGQAAAAHSPTRRLRLQRNIQPELSEKELFSDIVTAMTEYSCISCPINALRWAERCNIQGVFTAGSPAGVWPWLGAEPPQASTSLTHKPRIHRMTQPAVFMKLPGLLYKLWRWMVYLIGLLFLVVCQPPRQTRWQTADFYRQRNSWFMWEMKRERNLFSFFLFLNHANKKSKWSPPCNH